MANLEIRDLLGIPYKFENGPSVPHDGRLNCQSLVHEVYRCLGISLPVEMLSKEIYEDQVLFDSVDPRIGLNLGDILIFGRPRITDNRRLHLTVYVGNDENNTPLLIHASGVEGKVSIWPLNQFYETPGYRQLYAVKRYRQPPNQEKPV